MVTVSILDCILLILISEYHVSDMMVKDFVKLSNNIISNSGSSDLYLDDEKFPYTLQNVLDYMETNINKTQQKIPKPKSPAKEILPLVSGDKEPKTGLPLYTRSHLNHKLNINYKSIDNKALLFGDKYILHSDIIQWFSSYVGKL